MSPRPARSAFIAVAVALPALAPAAAARYTLIDNYQAYGGNTPAGGFNHGVFTQAPAGGEQYGRGPFNARCWNDDPQLAVADGATSTLFFRTLSGFHNYMGMSDANPAGEPRTRKNEKKIHRGGPRSRRGGVAAGACGS